MTAEAELALPALALHVVGTGEKLVKILDTERDVQELRLVGTRPENVVVIAAAFGAEEHTAIPRHVRDAEFEPIAIKADGLVEIATAENDVIDQLRRCLLVPGPMLVPSHVAS